MGGDGSYTEPGQQCFGVRLACSPLMDQVNAHEQAKHRRPTRYQPNSCLLWLSSWQPTDRPSECSWTGYTISTDMVSAKLLVTLPRGARGISLLRVHPEGAILAGRVQQTRYVQWYATTFMHILVPSRMRHNQAAGRCWFGPVAHAFAKRGPGHTAAIPFGIPSV